MLPVATLLQTRAPTGKFFGPVAGLLLSSPMTFHVSGVTVSAACANNGVASRQTKATSRAILFPFIPVHLPSGGAARCGPPLFRYVSPAFLFDRAISRVGISGTDSRRNAQEVISGPVESPRFSIDEQLKAGSQPAKTGRTAQICNMRRSRACCEMRALASTFVGRPASLPRPGTSAFGADVLDLESPL